MSIVSRAEFLRPQCEFESGAILDRALDLGPFPTQSRFKETIEIVTPSANEVVTFRPSAIVAAPPQQKAWDLLIFTEDGQSGPCYTYIDIKIALECCFPIADMVVNKLSLILTNHFTSRATADVNPLDEMRSICVVFSVYGASATDFSDKHWSKEEVLDCVNARIKDETCADVLARLQLTHVFVTHLFETNVHLMGKDQLDVVTIPMLLPLAQLALAVEGCDE